VWFVIGCSNSQLSKVGANLTFHITRCTRVCLTFIHVYSGSAEEVPNIPPYELNALYELYNSTAGVEWTWNEQPGVPWNFTQDANPCVDQWQGLSCTAVLTDGFIHIATIWLNAHNLQGPVPKTIANFDELQNLTLADNQLMGAMPAELFQLECLLELDISGSALTGPLPRGPYKCLGLSELNLGYNSLTGTLPEDMCSLTALTALLLANNEFTGVIPACLQALESLEMLDLSASRLVGSIPAELGLLLRLRDLDVSSNDLSGTIPNSFSALINIEQFQVAYNFISGTLPAYLGTFDALTRLIVYDNILTGTLPISVTKLPLLQLLHIYGNSLTGTLPVDLSGMTALTDFLGDHNMFSGPLPSSFGQLPNLQQLSMSSNRLSGTIPPAISVATALQLFNMEANLLTGSIPAQLFASDSARTQVLDLPLMSAVKLSDNRLTGSLPTTIGMDGDAVVLEYLDCASNHLTGSLPAALGNNAYLLYLNMSANHLSGTIPESITDLSVLSFLYLGSNLLHGSVPESIGEMARMAFLYLQSNFLSGTIPESIGVGNGYNSSALESVNISSNHLSGTIPRSIALMTQLAVLLLNDNKLTGPIDAAIDPTVQVVLKTLQISDNQLTGTLPDSLAQLPSLQVFAAVSNCFEGSIPEGLCSSNGLNTLALDGLQSATSCQRKLFPAALEGSLVAKSLYSTRNPLSGGVPGCLFGMGNLTTLHLSGNGLTGSIPAAEEISFSLRDLSLSHNMLTGTVPYLLLQRDWANLDLSYNRLTGSLPDNNGTVPYSSATAISLDNNRLSGRVPSALRTVTNITVLESNLFSCKTDRSDLPQHDSDEDKYECGSVTFDGTVYAWLAVVCIGAIAGSAVYLRKASTNVVRCLHQWWAASSRADTPHLTAVHGTVRVVSGVAVVCAGYAVLVLVPMYAACNAIYGTYTHQYAWAISAAYLSGSTPFAWEFTCLLLCTMVCVVTTAVVRRQFNITSASTLEDPSTSFRSTAFRFTVYFVVVVVNFVVVLGVNTAYVTIALSQNGLALTLAQIALALFKVAFNSACSPVLMRWACQRFLGRQPSAPSYVTLQLFVSVVNNILVPCLVVSIISPSCFYNIFKQVPDVYATYQYKGECTQFEVTDILECIGDQTLSAGTSYSPPFAYSYQCSSSFITYYSPAFVIMCMVAGFGIPLVQVLLLRLHGRAKVGSTWHAALDLVLPRILKPLPVAVGSSGVTGTSPLAARNLYAPFFDASQHVITLLTYLALLLTFGAVFPPLAVCFAVTVVCMAVFTRLKVGRFLANVRADDGHSGNAESSMRTASAAHGSAQCEAPTITAGHVVVLEQECEGVGSEKVLGRCVAMVVAFSCVFYTLFLFDTLGDAVGVSGAYWVLIATPLLGMLTGPLTLKTLTSGVPSAATKDVGTTRTQHTVKSPFAHEIEL
jgi:Leucine-rich repeat (LRR) protein